MGVVAGFPFNQRFLGSVAMISIALLVVSIISPIVLVFVNLVILAKYVDPQHAAGHYTAKLFVVRLRHCRPRALWRSLLT